MKKKLLAFVVVMVVMLSALLTGCKFFTLNADRNYHQVVAQVKYKEMTSDVYKGEIMNYVASYGSSYMQNYGMTVEQVVEYFYNNVSKQKLLNLYARDYVARNGVGIDPVTDDKAIAAMKPEDFLTVDERRYCIEQTNKQYEDQWKTKISALEKEQAAGEEDDEEDEKDKEEELAAREVRKSETSDEYIDKGLTDASKLPAFFEDSANARIKNETDNTKKSNMSRALKELLKTLDANFTDYDYFLTQQYESRIVAKYQDAIGKTVSPDSLNLNGRLETLREADLNSIVSEVKYAEALKAGTYTYFHAAEGYFNVKSILLKFSDAQTAVLNTIKALEGEEVVKQYREKIAFGTLEESDKYYPLLKKADEKADATKGLAINVSNPDYDSSVDELSAAYTDKGVDYRVVLYAMADGIAARAAFIKDSAAGVTDATQLKYLDQFARTDAFADWIYLVNDDSGMFSSEFYTVSPAGTDSGYVDEYTVLARELYKQGINAKSLSDKGDAAMNGTLAYGGENALLKVADGKPWNVFAREGKTTNANDKEASANIYTLVTADGNELSFIVNEFGIHIVMVTDIALTADKGDYEPYTNKDVEGFMVGKNYLYDYDVNVIYAKDEEGKDNRAVIESVTVKVRTVEDYLRETLTKEASSDLQTMAQIELFTDKDLIGKNDKVYKDILNYFA